MQIRVEERLAVCRKVLDETEPEKLSALSVAEMQSHYSALAKHLRYLESARMEVRSLDRMKLLQKEIEDRHHREVHGVAKKTYFWAVVAGITGIVLVVLAACPLIHDIYFSKAQPSTSPQASLETRPQSQSTTSASPEPEASSSTSTSSPEPTAAQISSTPEP